MNAYSIKITYCSHPSLRLALVLFVTIFGAYSCYICLNQTSIGAKSMLFDTTIIENYCQIHSIPPEEITYVHFPQPKTYSRDECSCTPVRFFAIFSMQRSGSGWFETLLNSHPNVSSNGEIFSAAERRDNISAIVKTLDKLYALDWLSSAAKNECVAAVGFKWMLNQGIMDYHKEILDYFNLNHVSIIFLFRRNILRRLISLLANDYDRYAKQLNGTHKSHVHSREEAEVLARFKPTINAKALTANFSYIEKTIADCLQFFSSTRHLLLYYEDIVNDHNALSHVQEFLMVPVRRLVSQQVKIHTRPLPEQVTNWEDIFKTLNGTQYERFLLASDYDT